LTAGDGKERLLRGCGVVDTWKPEFWRERVPESGYEVVEAAVRELGSGSRWTTERDEG
jgi:hypothetical protein